ncbi:hypothetical protein [Spiroplasma endosymbiont of Zeiraphera isertana]|uniref:hypothetical protein n=1 Tax=Spiroplasma endosymbiont of Zeiraphera isertana TaxID=3066313 RepID=UPI00313D051D
MYGYADSDYNLNGYEFIIKDNGGFYNWNIEFSNQKSIGFCIVDNKDFKWNFYLQATLGKIENRIIIDTVPVQYGYAYITIKSLKVNIYKIILNNR